MFEAKTANLFAELEVTAEVLREAEKTAKDGGKIILLRDHEILGIIATVLERLAKSVQ